MHHLLPPFKTERPAMRFLFLGLGLMLLLSLTLVACSGGSSDAEPTATEEPNGSIEATEEPQAQSASQILTTPVDSLPSIADIIDGVKPSVVSIAVVSTSLDFFLRPIAGQGNGSGVIVREDGYIATNYHVIKDADNIRVHLSDGRSYDAKVIGQDPLTDIAVVQIEANDLSALAVGDSRGLRVGEWVVSLGNALGLQGGPTATLGIVSAKDRTVRTEIGDLYGLVQTDAAINHGSSGGPLVNLDGDLVGINTVIIEGARGVGFAVGSSTFRPIVDSLIQYGRVIRPLIGLVGQDITSVISDELNLKVNQGVLITAVTPDGPSARAGLEVGDVITKLDSLPTRDMGEFLQVLWAYSVGNEVSVEYVRGDETLMAQVVLIERK